MFSEIKRKPLEQTFDRIINLGNEDGKDLGGMGLKLMEEVGELAECINFHLGNLPHKQMKEPAIGEAADVIQNVLAIVAKIYSHLPNDELIQLLSDQLELKTDKWQSIMFRK